MKTNRLFIAATLVLALLLSACGPAAETIEPVPTDSVSEPYPIETTQESGQAYPIEESPTQPESGDVSGGMAYITDPIASQDDLKDHAEDMTKFAVNLYRKLA